MYEIVQCEIKFSAAIWQSLIVF